MVPITRGSRLQKFLREEAGFPCKTLYKSYWKTRKIKLKPLVSLSDRRMKIPSTCSRTWTLCYNIPSVKTLTTLPSTNSTTIAEHDELWPCYEYNFTDTFHFPLPFCSSCFISRKKARKGSNSVQPKTTTLPLLGVQEEEPGLCYAEPRSRQRPVYKRMIQKNALQSSRNSSQARVRRVIVLCGP